MRNTILAVVLIFIYQVSPVYGGEEDFAWSQIMESGRFSWGKGMGADDEAAKKAADADLLSKIQVSIKVSQTSRTREAVTNKKRDFHDEYLQDQTSFTSLYLRGLEHLVLRDGDRYRALAYISKESLDESFNRRRHQILEFLKLGSRAESELRLGDALKNYYWAYLLSFTYPDTIQVKYDNISGSEVSIAAAEKINMLIHNIKVFQSEIYRDGSDIVADLKFTYRDEPIMALDFNYYSGLGTDYDRVRNGHAHISIYDEPTFPRRPLVITIDYAAESEMTTNEEIASLYEVFRENEMPNKVSVELSFPWLAPKPGDDLPQPEPIPDSDIDMVLKKEPEPKRPSPISSDAHPIELLALREIENSNDFIRNLEILKRGRVLEYGNRDKFKGGAGCYVAILDDDSLYGIFYFSGDEYTEISSGRRLQNLREDFKGKYEIWIRDTE